MKKTATYTVRVVVEDLKPQFLKEAKKKLLEVPGVRSVDYDELISEAECGETDEMEVELKAFDISRLESMAVGSPFLNAPSCY